MWHSRRWSAAIGQGQLHVETHLLPRREESGGKEGRGRSHMPVSDEDEEEWR